MAACVENPEGLPPRWTWRKKAHEALRGAWHVAFRQSAASPCMRLQTPAPLYFPKPYTHNLQRSSELLCDLQLVDIARSSRAI
mmetsp:Transcript_58677/g.121235  ORF Transcript_58677/g.121235 Transcript_58677/m.121235 type:complete len:83 (+) Transcript_58677:27-275(+)